MRIAARDPNVRGRGPTRRSRAQSHSQTGCPATELGTPTPSVERTARVEDRRIDRHVVPELEERLQIPRHVSARICG